MSKVKMIRSWKRYENHTEAIIYGSEEYTRFMREKIACAERQFKHTHHEDSSYQATMITLNSE